MEVRINLLVYKGKIIGGGKNFPRFPYGIFLPAGAKEQGGQKYDGGKQPRQNTYISFHLVSFARLFPTTYVRAQAEVPRPLQTACGLIGITDTLIVTIVAWRRRKSNSAL